MSVSLSRLHRGAAGPVWRLGPVSLLLRPRPLAVTAILLALVVTLIAVALTTGTTELAPRQVLAVLFGADGGSGDGRVIWNVRLPRVLTALFVGAALALSGMVFQSISRNPLGSPDIIGFTVGAATGAIAQIVLFGQNSVAVSVAAILGCLLTATVVYLLAMRDNSIASYRLILVGIGMGAVLTALNDVMLVKGDLDNAASANLWLAGSLSARTWLHALPVIVGVAALLPPIVLAARRLALIEMGDDLARQLGVGVEPTRALMVFCAVALAALATGAAGPIAFIALAAAPLAARLCGAQGLPVLATAAMGAGLLLGADLVSQRLPFGLVVPIGRMTGVLGGLYLIWLLSRLRRI